MSKISNKSLEQIFEVTNFILAVSDVAYFCSDTDTLSELVNYTSNKKLYGNDLKDFLIQHQNTIDKEKLVLIMAFHYKQQINNLNEKLQIITASFPKILQNEETFDIQNEILGFEHEISLMKNCLENCKKLLKDVNTSIAITYYNKENKQNELIILDSRKINGNSNFNKSNQRNLKRLQKIDEDLKQKDEDNESGMEYMLQPMIFTDLNEVFPDDQFGYSIRSVLLQNEIIKSKIKTQDELNELKANNYNEYLDITENVNIDSILKDTKDILEKYAQYVDIDKLITICSYRYYEALENNTIKPEFYKTVADILQTVLPYIKDTKKRFHFTLQLPNSETNEMEDISYGVKDIKNCLAQFTEDEYLTTKYIDTKRKEIFSKEINLQELNPTYVDVIFTPKQLEDAAKLSDENLLYVAMKLNWNRNKILQSIITKKCCGTDILMNFISNQNLLPNDIIQIYMQNIISLEQVSQINGQFDLSSGLNSYELIQYYKNSIEKDSTDADKEKYLKYLNIYKEILITDKSELDINNQSNELMEKIVENYDYKTTEDYLNQLKHFYKQGVLTLNTVLDWNDELIIKDFVTDLFKEDVIDLKDVQYIIKNRKLSFEYVDELVWKPDITYEERIKILEEGWIPEETILNLFSNALIREQDLLKLVDMSIINKSNAENIISKTSLQDLEEHSDIVLYIDDTVKKIKRETDIYGNGDHSYVAKSKVPRLIIDPNERMELFNLLGVGIPDEVHINKTNPFYNYEFYVMPDESGKVTLNSVVIAERIYEVKEENLTDKDTIMKFATDNATYFFKYKDLMVLSNYMKKQNVVQEKKNVIFRANHALASEHRIGHWGASVIYGIAKAMLSSDLTEYTKEDQRKIIVEKLLQVYGYDQFKKILDKSLEIDLGKYNCEIIDNDEERD